MVYKPLPMHEVSLSKLQLDLENYRIPTKRDDEAGALSYLFASEDVMGAARLIIRDGYFDNEVPIVVATGSGSDPNFVVLEGNRRVSALKALQDPTIVPGHEIEVRALLKRYAVEADDLPDRIRVLVAPNRAAASPHVARLHTGVPKRRWSRDQQATFYYSLVDGQNTVDDVKARYPDVEVVRFMKMAVVRRLLAAAPFVDTSLRQYAASADLAMSAFEYAYRPKEIAAVIGIEFDKEGMLVPRSSTPEKIAASLPKGNLRALEYLVGEFRAERLNTRSPELKRSNEAYLPFVEVLTNIASQKSDSSGPESPSTGTGADRSAGADEGAGSGSNSGRGSGGGSGPSGSPNGGTDGNESGGGTGGSPGGSGRSGAHGPNHPDTRDVLDLTGLGYENTHYNLKLRYFELRIMSLSKVPIAAAILLRSVLESTIKVHFERTTTPVTGQLNDVFKQVAKTYGGEKSLRSTINAIQNGNAHKPGSIQWFNLIAHSADATPDAGEVRQAWKLVGPLLRRLLQSAPSAAPASP